MVEGVQWTKDHLNVQLCEDLSHCLRETIDVEQGYSCSRFPDIHFLSVPSWARVLANEAGGVTILSKQEAVYSIPCSGYPRCTLDRLDEPSDID